MWSKRSANPNPRAMRLAYSVGLDVAMDIRSPASCNRASIAFTPS